jgi:hypothetical protein
MPTKARRSKSFLNLPGSPSGYQNQRPYYEQVVRTTSPAAPNFFYKRGYDERATAAMMVDEVMSPMINQVETPVTTASQPS